MKRFLFIAITLLAMLCSCYHDRGKQHDALPANAVERRLDSISFESNHHYSINYNFVVKTDSLVLLRQQPEEYVNNMFTDSVSVFRHDRLVVADIRIIPDDPIDSIWVQVARDQETFGWTHESELLPCVVPSDPISQFISTFSDMHLLIFLLIISIISITYLMRTIFRRNAKIVHFNDIPTFYPTLLTMIIASAATFYASIQLFAPEVWRHFYYHPTLNPFTVPPLLSIFLVSVWSLLIVGLATVDIVRRMLPLGECVLYLCGLLGICAINYIVFSISTLYYVGYVLYAAYMYFAVTNYLHRYHPHYICGNCGKVMLRKGRCPSCGVMNE